MQEKYESPELKLVGTTDMIVLGSLGGGDDVRNEFMAFDAEFQEDHYPAQLHA